MILKLDRHALTPIIVVILFACIACSCSAQSKYLLWTSSFQEIHTSDLTKTGIGPVETPFPDTNGNIGGADVSRTNGRIYWTVSSGSGSIVSANLNGTDIRTIVSTPPLSDSRFFSGITVDNKHDQLYFADKRNNAIYRSNLDGSNAHIIVPASGSPSNARGIEDLRLDIQNGHLYWTDNRFNVIRRSNLDGSAMQDILAVQLPYDIDLDLVNNKIYWTELGPNGLSGQGKIRSANMDGTGIQTLVSTNLWWPTGIAVDPASDRLFWLNSWYSGPTNYANTLQSSTLTGANRQILANFGFSRPQLSLTLVIPEPNTILLISVSCAVFTLRLRRTRLSSSVL